MWSVLLSCIDLLLVLYVLCLWIIPAVVQYSGCLALLWHDVIVEKALDAVTRTTRPQRLLKAVQDRAIRGNPQSVISVIDHYCRNQEWAMNMGDEKGFILDSVVSELNPQTVLELGTYCGYSAVRIGRLLHSGARLLTLEFNPDYAAVAREVISWAGLKNTVQLVEGASGHWIPHLREHFGIHTFDFIFLDHWKERYLADIKLLEECRPFRKGTVLLADNNVCRGAPDYLEYVRKSPLYDSWYFKSHLEYTKAEECLEKTVYLG